MSLFDIEITAAPAVTTVRLSGEIDMAAVPAIEERLRPVLDTEPPTLVLDLSAVSFFDSSALRLVLRLDALQRDQGRRLAIVQGGKRVARVFELTGVDGQLEFVAPDEVPSKPA